MDGNRRNKSKIPTRHSVAKGGKHRQNKQTAQEVVTTTITTTSTQVKTDVGEDEGKVVSSSHREEVVTTVKTPSSSRIPRLKSSSVDSGFSSTFDSSFSPDREDDVRSPVWEPDDDRTTADESSVSLSDLNAIPISDVVIVDEVIAADDGPKEEQLVQLTTDSYEIVVTDQDVGDHGLLVVSDDFKEQAEKPRSSSSSSSDDDDGKVQPEVIVFVNEEKMDLDELDQPIVNEEMDNHLVETSEPQMMDELEDICEQEEAEYETEHKFKPEETVIESVEVSRLVSETVAISKHADLEEQMETDELARQEHHDEYMQENVDQELVSDNDSWNDEGHENLQRSRNFEVEQVIERQEVVVQTVEDHEFVDENVNESESRHVTLVEPEIQPFSVELEQCRVAELEFEDREIENEVVIESEVTDETLTEPEIQHFSTDSIQVQTFEDEEIKVEIINESEIADETLVEPEIPHFEAESKQVAEDQTVDDTDSDTGDETSSLKLVEPEIQHFSPKSKQVTEDQTIEDTDSDTNDETRSSKFVEPEIQHLNAEPKQVTEDQTIEDTDSDTDDETRSSKFGEPEIQHFSAESNLVTEDQTIEDTDSDTDDETRSLKLVEPETEVIKVAIDAGEVQEVVDEVQETFVEPEIHPLNAELGLSAEDSQDFNQKFDDEEIEDEKVIDSEPRDVKIQHSEFNLEPQQVVQSVVDDVEIEEAMVKELESEVTIETTDVVTAPVDKWVISPSFDVELENIESKSWSEHDVKATVVEPELRLDPEQSREAADESEEESSSSVETAIAVVNAPCSARSTEAQVTPSTNVPNAKPVETRVASRTERILATSNMLKACLGHRPSVLDVRSSSINVTHDNYRPSNLQVTSVSGDLLLATPEEVDDLATLDKMLEAAGHYEQRRRIRAQMRLLKKKQDEASQRLTNDYRWQRVDDLVSSSLISAHYGSSIKQQTNGHDDTTDDTNKPKETLSLTMGDNSLVNGINLLSIQDELVLHEMLDKAEDYEDRKKIRARLKDVLADHRAMREEIIRKREQEHEDSLRNRMRDSEEHKRRTLAMYDAMAKSAPAGGNKVMDVNYLREGHGSAPGSPTTVEAHKVDQCEQAIRLRQKEANERKARVLAAYDTAAKSGPAGSARFIDFDTAKPQGLQNAQSKLQPSSCFQMKGGIPTAAPAVVPIILPKKGEDEYDPMEAAIRKRQKECDDRKRRTLDAFDKAARSRPAGAPISIYIPQCEGVEPVFEVANKAKLVSPREKFQRLDSSSSSSANGTNTAPGITFAKPAVSNVTRSPTAIKEMLLNWCKSKTKEYENIKIENFSTAWNDGMAFCALIHHFYPDAFDYHSLDPKNRRHNFDLAFRVAEEKGDVAPLLEVDDMVMMKKPDWKCVFTYVQSLYRRFHKVD